MLDTMNDIVSAVRQDYPYFSQEKVELMLECARDICISTLYPFDYEIETIPRRFNSWLYRCIIEQIERKGMTSAIGYAENGLNVKFDRAQISQALIDELTPKAGVF